MEEINKKELVIEFLRKNKNEKYTAIDLARILIKNNSELEHKMTKQVENRSQKPDAQLAAEIGAWFSKLRKDNIFFNYVSRKEISKNRYIYFYKQPTLSSNTNNDDLNTNSLLKDTIFFGPPGTGKSTKIEDLTKHAKSYRTTFHPEYTYSDFLGQYKPVVGYHTDSNSKLDRETFEINGKLVKGKKPIVLYDFVPGIFTKALLDAIQNPEEKVFLIIEEINRGNCAAIFGDIFQLLDRNDENGSEFPIDIPTELSDYIESMNYENENINLMLELNKLKLPNNFFILASMNTSDQSLFQMDAAFKRRWEMEYVSIEYNNEDLKNAYFITDKENTKKYKWLDFLKQINMTIEKVYNNEEKQLGQWFVSFKDDENGIKFFDEKTFKNKVLSHLFFDVFKYKRIKIFKSQSFAELMKCNSLEEIFKDDVLNKDKKQKPNNNNSENNDQQE